MNRMKEIAAMFGKELDEEFRVKSCHPERNCIGRFTKYGFGGHNQTATANVAVFLLLLTGRAVIINE